MIYLWCMRQSIPWTYLLAPYVTPADAHDRAQVDGLVATAQEVTEKTVDVCYFDRGYTG